MSANLEYEAGQRGRFETAAADAKDSNCYSFFQSSEYLSLN